MTAVPKTGIEVEDRIRTEVLTLSTLLTAKVRVWRYVESQKALFGFIASDPDQIKVGGKILCFESFIAFLRVSGIYDGDDGMRQQPGSEPFWDVRPGGILPESSERTTAWILFAKKSEDRQATEVLGVVSVEVAEDAFRKLNPDLQGKIRQALLTIRDALRTYSLLQFYDGFKTAREFIRRGEPTSELTDQQTIEKGLVTLIKNLRADQNAVTIYIRRLTAEETIGAGQSTKGMPLLTGVGDFCGLLRKAEEKMSDEKRTDYFNSMFSQHAYEFLKRTPESTTQHEAEGILFPGGGSKDDYDDHENWLKSAQATLCDAVHKWDPVLASDIREWSDEMIAEGSFGVFPIRWITATETSAPLIGLLCVTARNIRHFFTWTRCLLLEQFCQRLGRQHSDLTPFLDSVYKDTHEKLMSSLDVLRRVAPPSILISSPAKEERQCFAFVLSVDIRKSTDLMARMVPAYADVYGDVLIGLWNKMKEAVLEEYGIFDKFTGDGILAYFPDFFEADRRTAALRLLRAVEKCHDAFRKSYPVLWKALSAVPATGSADERSAGRAGLGIGLDFGSVRLVNVGAELTIVGAPVVYACRLASAAWGFTTLANYPCYHAFRQSRVLDLIDATSVSIPIKHEEIHAYRICRRSWLSAPTWKLEREREDRWDAGWLKDDESTSR